MKKCFECDGHATEEHHIIPKSLGGTKTVPLCAICHAKVHGLQNTGRADLAPELTKRGLDKFGERPFEYFAVYQCVELYDASTVKEIKKILNEKFDLSISEEKISRLRRRLYEMDSSYRTEFFNSHIGKELSFVWDDNSFAIQNKIKFEVIKEYIERGLVSENENINSDVINLINEDVQKRFDKEIMQP